MAVTFAYRSDQIEPRFVSVITQSLPYREVGSGDDLPSVKAVTTEVGVIGDTFLDVQEQSSQKRTVRYIGHGNVPDFTTGFSINTRVIPRYTTAPTSDNDGYLWTFFGLINPFYAYLRHDSDGSINVNLIDGIGASIIVNVTTATSIWSPTSGTAADVTLTWTGDTTANGIKIYVNASLVGQGTASAASNFSAADGNLFSQILPTTGISQSADYSGDLNELTIWNEVIDPSAVTLTSGSGALNAARTAFVDVEENDQVASAGGGGGLFLGGNRSGFLR